MLLGEIFNGPEYWRLKKVLMFKPTEEVKTVDESNYKSMLFRRPIDYDLLLKQFEDIVDIFHGEKVKVILLNDLFEEMGWRPRFIPPNMMFMRDVLGVFKDKVFLGNMTYEARRFEPIILETVFKYFDVKVIKRFSGKAFFEGGDFMFLNEDTVLVGYGPRTSFEAAYEIAKYANQEGFNSLLISLPPYRVHLDGGMMPISKDLIIAHIPTLKYYPSIVFYRDGGFDVVKAYDYLRGLGYDFISVDDEESKSFGPNVVVLKEYRVISYSWNKNVLERLRNAGVEVIEFNGTEYRDAGGGPHCIFNTMFRSR